LNVGDSGESKVVQVLKARLCMDQHEEQLLGNFQCPKVEKTDEVAIIPSTNVVDKVCLVHDCLNGNCFFGQSENTMRIERENITRERYTYVHNTDYNYYLLNKFYLGDSMKYFNIA
jgi:hypothetical protein